MCRTLRLNNRSDLWPLSLAFLFVVGFLYLARSSYTVSSQKYTRHAAAAIETASAPQTRETEARHNDGVLRYTRVKDGSEPDLLWLAITYDGSSWGKESRFSRRTFDDFLQIVVAQYDVHSTSLGLLTSSPNEYEIYKSTLQRYDFPKVEIFLHQGFHDGPTIDRDHRHNGDVQTIRRAEISKLRNYLMLKALQDETHILWLDADIYYLDKGIAQRMISHVRNREDVGILTARCEIGNNRNYDLNAWRGTRQGPRGWDLNPEEIERGEMELQGQHHIDELIEGTSDDDLVSLDTVGATILYMRASLVWQGLNFPHQYVVGTRWAKDGWDGIESEGLCYRSRGLKGGKCMALGGSWHVKHTTG